MFELTAMMVVALYFEMEAEVPVVMMAVDTVVLCSSH
jgi:hypothetical protein